MPEESRNIAQAIRFIPMYGGVVIPKGMLKAFSPNAVELAEALADQTVKSGVGAFLRATLYDHVRHFNLKTGHEEDAMYERRYSIPLGLHRSAL
jgi:hypothetical protein